MTSSTGAKNSELSDVACASRCFKWVPPAPDVLCVVCETTQPRSDGWVSRQTCIAIAPRRKVRSTVRPTGTPLIEGPFKASERPWLLSNQYELGIAQQTREGPNTPDNEALWTQPHGYMRSASGGHHIDGTWTYAPPSRGAWSESERVDVNASSTTAPIYSLIEPLLTVRQIEVLKAVYATDGSRVQAAELLGTNPDNVRNLLQGVRRRVAGVVSGSMAAIYVFDVLRGIK